MIIENAMDFVKECFKTNCCGHDFEHVTRVYQNAKAILADENCDADEEIVLLGAILHDVDDSKLVGENEARTFKNTKDFLNTQNLSENKIEKVIETISTVSMKDYLSGNYAKSIEAKIVFDADKLDQIGAAAIARTFAFGAVQGRKIFDAEKYPTAHYDGKYPEGYDSGINYIIEMLLTVKSKLHTKTAQRIAQKRHEFMMDYLTQFFEETGDSKWQEFFESISFPK